LRASHFCATAEASSNPGNHDTTRALRQVRLAYQGGGPTSPRRVRYAAGRPASAGTPFRPHSTSVFVKAKGRQIRETASSG
jgi:hypothetical protein